MVTEADEILQFEPLRTYKMANKKFTDLDNLASPAGADILAIVDDVAGTPTTKKVTATNLMTLAPVQTSDLANYSPAFFTTVAESTTARTLSDSDNGKIIVCSNRSNYRDNSKWTYNRIWLHCSSKRYRDCNSCWVKHDNQRI